MTADIWGVKCDHIVVTKAIITWFSGQEPEVLLPPGADEVPTDALALLPHRQRQALRLVDALLHKLLAAAPQEAARNIELQHRHLNLLKQGMVFFPVTRNGYY